jgi:protein-disulfide isomerase
MLLFCLGCCFLSLDVRSEQKGVPDFPWDLLSGIRIDEYKNDFKFRVQSKLESVRCYGKCTKSVAACVRQTPPGKTAIRLSRDIFRLMSVQATNENIDLWVKKRRQMAYPKPEDIRQFNLDDSVVLGDPKAPIVIVEYSDFQCPFCSLASPVLEKAVQKSHGKARLYLKQFPLKNHPRSLPAAKACVTAGLMGKFWEYCPKLFLSKKNLSDEHLIAIAAEVGLDAHAFANRMAQEDVLNRIADEKMEGLKNRVKSTPTIFINGKQVLLVPTVELIVDRIEEELDIIHGKD